MLSLGAFAFASPWLLLGLAVLPALWWLLRVTPPSPRRLRFPAIRLLFGLVPREETPARTPLWLILLRMALAALAILAFAHPLLNPDRQIASGGPLLIAVDDGWAAAHDWEARQRVMGDLIEQAGREDRNVVLLGTAPAGSGADGARPPALLRPADARVAAEAMRPHPWPTDRLAALERLDKLPLPQGASVAWLSDGLDGGDGDHQAEAYAFAEGLQKRGATRVLTGPPERSAALLGPAQQEGPDLAVALHRAWSGAPQQYALRVTGEDGRLLARQTVQLEADQKDAAITVPMPAELRNQAVRAEIEGEETAGAVLLLDERWRRRPVGIAEATSGEAAQPLLSGHYYLERALAPFSEIRHGPPAELLRREIAMMVLADRVPMSGAEHASLISWMEAGGVVLRFAGPDLAENGDDLLPVTLRRGGRTIGGALSWEQPAHLAEFPAASPFAGLAIPPDVTVARQVLAEPSLDLEEKSWARLSDGTPLVTGEKRGKGWLVLVHTTSSPAWSNLALSGLFVDMLRRVTALGHGVAGAGEAALPPVEILDGFGRLQKPPAGTKPIAAKDFAATLVSPAQPPGYYGTEDARQALNLASAVPLLRPMGRLPDGVRRENLAQSAETDLRPPLLTVTLLLLLIDLAIAYALRGMLPQALRRFGLGSVGRGAVPVVLLGFLLAAMGAPPGRAASDSFALQASSGVHLAYIKTGDPEMDGESKAGLQGLSDVLTHRTAIEAAAPMEVDPETDELIFFPLLYWPITAAQPNLSPEAVSRLNRFLATGGTIFFDTRDQGKQGGAGSARDRLRQLVSGLDIPPLQILPPDHVLTKSFYLMQDFPGRWTGGDIWIEPTEDRVNDGVSTIIIGANDYAGAWAVDDSGRPSYSVIPGGEAQREMAYRFGVNLVMYTLTGNYKSDQVHVPAILERLGQ